MSVFFLMLRDVTASGHQLNSIQHETIQLNFPFRNRILKLSHISWLLFFMEDYNAFVYVPFFISSHLYFFCHFFFLVLSPLSAVLFCLKNELISRFQQRKFFLSFFTFFVAILISLAVFLSASL